MKLRIVFFSAVIFIGSVCAMEWHPGPFGRPGEQRSLDEDFFRAVARGDAGEIKSLIRSGANVNAIDRYGHSLLHEALSNGRISAKEILLEAGAHLTPQEFVEHVSMFLTPQEMREYEQKGEKIFAELTPEQLRDITYAFDTTPEEILEAQRGQN